MRLPAKLPIVPLALLLAFACAGSGSAQSSVQRVNINLTCPQNLESDNLALHVTVAPWIRTAAPGDTISWNLVVGGGGRTETAFTIQAKGGDASTWPFPDGSYPGDGQIDLVVPEATADGDSNYDIVLSCNQTEVLIDPGMRIGR